MSRIVFPAGKGIEPYVGQNVDRSAKHIRQVPVADLTPEHFDRGPDSFMCWPPSVVDVHRIVQLAEAVKSPDREIPVILDVGTGAGLLPLLIAETERAAVLGVDPHAVMDGSIYTHANLQYRRAGIEWIVENFSPGDFDLAIWSWPEPELKPLQNLRKLSPRGALLIYNISTCRLGVSMVGRLRYYYQIDPDRFLGFKKCFLWNGIDIYEHLAPTVKPDGHFDPRGANRRFAQNNTFVFYVNRRLGVEVPLPNDAIGVEEYPWMQTAQEYFTQFPVERSVAIIGDRYVLCPEFEDFL